MAKKKKTPAVSYGSIIPQTFGAAGDAINSYVTFGIGTIDKIISGSDSSQGLIAFGYNTELKSGAIAVGGELVSSKILDVSTNATEDTKATIVTVTYLDSSELKEITFDVIDPSVIEALDSSLNNLYQEVIDNEEVIIHYLEIIDTSVQLLTQDVSILKNYNTSSNSSINYIEDNFVKSIIPIDSSAIAINNITPVGTNGKQYEIGVVVDDNTVKIENGQLTAYGNTYTIKQISIPTEGYLKTYQLYQTDAAGTETAIPNAIIDIPKDFVVKEVHLCKAITEEVEGEIVYTETAKITDPDFDQAEGELYLHFIWQTKDTSAMTSETFLKVTELASIYKGDADDDSSDGKYISITNTHVITFDTSKFKEDVIDSVNSSIDDLYQQLINDEQVLVNYFVLLDTSINLNTADISILKEQLNSADSELDDIIDNVETLNSSVSTIEETYVQDVSSTTENSSLIIRNTYTPDYESAVAVPEIEVADTSVTYTITKTVNGVEEEVVKIQTVNPTIITDIADILTDYGQRLDEAEHKMTWITL